VEERYLVRIYRRDPRNPSRVTGVVERAEQGGRRAFRTVSGLLEALALDRRGRRIRVEEAE